MTLRTKGTAHSHHLNQVFSDLLFLQSNELPEVIDLRANGPLLKLLPPPVIKAVLRFLVDPTTPPESIEPEGLHYACFAHVNDALSAIPDLPVRSGHPFAISEFLKSSKGPMLFDFAPLGVVIISQQSSLPSGSEGIHNHLLLPFLHYAMGPDLWGPHGKWTRFHERLHILFKKHELLQDNDLPGRYPLDLSAKRLENFGFKGDQIGEQFVLTMPWTFSLSQLNKLEDVLAREF